MQQVTQQSALAPGPPGDAAPPADPRSQIPAGLVSAPPAASPLVRAVRGWIVSQATSPKALGAVATAAVGIVGGTLSIDYVRGVVWPAALGAEARLKPETLEIRAWNTGAGIASLRNVTLAVTEDGYTTRWTTDEIDWREPASFAAEGLALAKDGHESEFARVVGKAMPSAVFFELGGQCRFHVEATFDRRAVRLPSTGACACDAACRL